MKKWVRKQGLIIVYFTSILLSLSGCKKYFDNENPNGLSEAPISTVLTNVTVNVGYANGAYLHRLTALWVQQFSGQGGPATVTSRWDKYNIGAPELNPLWGSYYTEILPDIEYILKRSDDAPYYTGIAKILKAWCFHQLVDLWNDVPYTEALKLSENRLPVYDQAASIYSDLVRLLDEAIQDLSGPPSGLVPSNNETIFNGNPIRWIQLANTLKLRIALHYSEIDSNKAGSDITATLNSGVPFISENVDNFQMAFIDGPNAQNSIHQFEAVNNDQFFPSRFFIDLMNSKSDPRRPFYFTPYPYLSQPATYAGASPGDPQSIQYSRLHTYLRGSLKNDPVPNQDGSLSANSAVYTGAAPIRMLTASEYYFIRAEAALKFSCPGDPEELFREGIRTNMEDVGVNASDVQTYLDVYGHLDGTNSEKLRQIIEEKYVALYGVALEPFNDWRRTGFPIIKEIPNSSYPGKGIPTICWYPQIEINSNPNAKQRADLFQKVFWDP